MGNTLALMQKFVDSDSTESAKEMLERLEDMAQDRIDLFYEKIGHGDCDKNLIPISKVLNKHTYIGATVENNDCWIQEAKEAVNDFSTGPVADGLYSIAINTIVKMLGSGAGKRQTKQRYAISIDFLGGISRLDYYIFTYTFSSTELARKGASLIACCVVESSADIQNIDPNTLRVIVSRAFRGGDVPHSTLTAIYAQLVAAINRPMSGFWMTDKEKESVENWYNPGSQKSLADGDGDKSSFNSGFNSTGFTQTGFDQSGFIQTGFSQGGFQPVGTRT